jgi:hypothetical protein
MIKIIFIFLIASLLVSLLYFCIEEKTFNKEFIMFSIKRIVIPALIAGVLLSTLTFIF